MPDALGGRACRLVSAISALMICPQLEALRAQDPATERVATECRVLGPDGSPAANAVVTFVGSRPPHGDRFEASDHVEAVANEKGRVRVRLRSSHRYSCWAVGRSRDNGHRDVSEAVPIRPGSGIELTLSEERPAARLSITGMKAWSGITDLRPSIAISCDHLCRLPMTLTDGSAPLPALPKGSRWLLFFHDADGRLVHGEQVRAAGGTVTFAMPAPQRVKVRVVDAQGKPVAGAAIDHEVGSMLWRPGSGLTGKRGLAEWRWVGRTARDGSAEVTIANRGNPLAGEGYAMLRARKPGFQASLGGWNGQRIVDGRGAERGDAEPTELPFTLKKATNFGGSALDANGAPMRGTALELTAELKMPLVSGAVLSRTAYFRTVTADDGTYSFEGLPSGLSSPTLRIDCPHPPALVEPDLEKPFPIHLGNTRTLAVETLDSTGNPARCADVLLVPLPIKGRDIDSALHHTQLDQRGRRSLRLQPGDWFVFVTDGKGFAHASIDGDSAPSLSLELQDFAHLRGKVLLDDESQRPAVRFRISSTGSGPPNAAEETLVLRAIGSQLNRWLVGQTTVAADGSFDVRFLFLDMVRYGAAARAGRNRCSFRLQPSDNPIELDLRSK